MYRKYQIVMGYLHDNAVSNAGHLQAMQELKPNKLLYYYYYYYYY